jgi:integrase
MMSICIHSAATLSVSSRYASGQLSSMRTLGHDPQGQKIEDRARAAETFEPAMRRFLQWKKDRLKPRSYEEVERHLVKHAKPLHSLQLAKIDRRTIASRLAELTVSHTPKVSDAVRSSLSALFTWAMKEGLIDAHPVIGTNRAHEARSRDHVLTVDEIREVWNALPDNDYGDIVRLLILLGLRRDEVGSLSWSEVDLHRALITLPGSRTKNRCEHTVPLAPAALAILESRWRKRQQKHKSDDSDEDQRDFIFGNGQGGFSGWSKSKAGLDQSILEARQKAANQSRGDATKIKPMIWRLHDLRRTMSTVMHDGLGISPHIVEATLGHISGHKAGVAGTYNRAQYEHQVRAALERWAAHIEALVHRFHETDHMWGIHNFRRGF